MRLHTRVFGAAGLFAGLLACSPALDWRELKSADSPLVFSLPCKPSVQERSVPLAGANVLFHLQACAAGGVTWGLASADVADPAKVGTALQELAAAARSNIAGRPLAETQALVPGQTPNPSSRRWRIEGRRMESQQTAGESVQMQLVVFAYGTRVFQATALGTTLPADATDAFFGALRLAPR